MDRNEIARRRAKRRKAARRRHLLVGFVAFLIIALAVFIALSLTVLFPIKNVSYGGSKVYTAEQLENGMKIKGENIFTVSAKKIVSSSRPDFPYIGNVKIKRQLPDSLTVEITDATEHSAYFFNNKYYIVDKDGYVLKEDIILPKNLVIIKVKKAKFSIGKQVEFSDKSVESSIKKIYKHLNENNIKINSIDATDKAYYTAEILDGRFTVEFGSKNDLDKKIKHLSAMIKRIDSNVSGTIDLTCWSESNPTGILEKSQNKVS